MPQSQPGYEAMLLSDYDDSSSSSESQQPDDGVLLFNGLIGQLPLCCPKFRDCSTNVMGFKL